MKSIYCVQLYLHNDPIALFESSSVNNAIKFIDTIDRSKIDVDFYRHRPFRKFNVDEIMEIWNNGLSN